jgi:energy-coupling factor transporter ATP-binding protein EcfA2
MDRHRSEHSDVFVSYNASDRPEAQALAEELKRRGMRVWLDIWELVPGHPWQEALEHAILRSTGAIICIGRSGVGPWEEREMRACLASFVRNGGPVIPVLLPGAPEQPRLPPFLEQFTWVDLRGGLNGTVVDLVEWGITGIRPATEDGGQGVSSEGGSGLVADTYDPLVSIRPAMLALWRVGTARFGKENTRAYCEAYLTALEDDCARMQILGMEQPVPLSDIFTEVRLVNRVRARAYRSIEELQAETREAVRQRSLETTIAAVERHLTEAVRAETIRSELSKATAPFEREADTLVSELGNDLARLGMCIEAGSEAQRALDRRVAQHVESVRDTSRRYDALRDQEKREYELAERQFQEGVTGGSPEDIEAHRRQRQEARQRFSRRTGELAEQEQAELAALESEARPLVTLWDEYLAAQASIARRKRAEIVRARREVQRRAISIEERNAVLAQLDDQVERELERQVQRELTMIVFDDFGQATRPDGEKRAGWDAVESKERALILGQPGAGKTTLLKHVALRHLAPSSPRARFPFFVALRRFVPSQHRDMRVLLADDLASCGVPDAIGVVEDILKGQDECILLFDGLDEVPNDQQEKVVSEIVLLARRYRQHRLVVSCRTANYRGQLEGFSEFEICEFTDEQVARFVSGWFRSSDKLASQFLRDIRRHPGLRELTTTPLLLALLCIGYRRNQRFPDQRALIYLNSLDALLIDWDSSKQLRRGSFVERFDTESKKVLISKVACDSFCEDSLFFSESEIIGRLEMNSDALPIPSGSGRGMLREYVENHGLLVERANGVFSFSHLTVQEFLAALHLARGHPIDVFERLARESYGEPRWKEVVLFLGGLLPRADSLVVCLRNQLKASLENRRFAALLLGRRMPDGAAAYIARTKTVGDPDAWDAWFRWRLFEIRLHEASYAGSQPDVFVAIARSHTARFIARATGIETGHRQGLDMSRPITRALAESLDELRSQGTPDLSQEVDDVNRYVMAAGLVAEIISSGARVAPDLRLRILQDIGHSGWDNWPHPALTNRNILGA